MFHARYVATLESDTPNQLTSNVLVESHSDPPPLPNAPAAFNSPDDRRFVTLTNYGPILFFNNNVHIMRTFLPPLASSSPYQKNKTRLNSITINAISQLAQQTNLLQQ